MKELKILYLEDSARDAELAAKALRKAGIPFTFRLVGRKDEYREALMNDRPDLILADDSLVNFDSLEALSIFKRFNYQIPFIIVSGTASEEFAITVLKEGASDLLLKDHLLLLPKVILEAQDKVRSEQQRQQYLERLIASNTMLQQSEQLAHLGSWQLECSSGQLKWSDETFRIWGYEPEAIEPDLEIFVDRVHPEDKAAVKKVLETSGSAADSKELVFRITDINGNGKHIALRTKTEYSSCGAPMRRSGFLQDITDRKEAEESLLKEVQERAREEKEELQQQLCHQKQIAQHAIQAQENQMNALALELHDNINQVLASAKFFLEMAKDNVVLGKEMVSRGCDNISYALEEIRKLSQTLVTPSLGAVSLEEALQELLSGMNLAGAFSVNLYFENFDECKLPADMELMLYRVVQEQLNNITKHSRATKVTVTLLIMDKSVFLAVADNGVGFDPSKKVKGIGLKNISNRVKLYSGTLHIVAGRGKGCTLEVNIPINNTSPMKNGHG